MRNKAPEEIFQMQDYCETLNVSHANRIIQITNHTFFIYILFPTTMNVICPENEHNITITKSKLIETRTDCKMRLFPNITPETGDILMKKENFRDYTEKIEKSGENVGLNQDKTSIWQIVSTICIFFLFMATWIMIKYHNRQFLRQLNQFMSKPTKTYQNPLDFNCSFTFSKPSLPPKRRALFKSKSDTIRETPDYDWPKENTQNRSEESIETTV